MNSLSSGSLNLLCWHKYKRPHIVTISACDVQGGSFTKMSQLNQHPIRAWISNYIHIKQWDVIIHPCPNFDNDLTKPPLKLRHGWVVTSHINYWCNYRQISNIRRTKSQNLNVSRLVLQLSLPNLLKPCIKLRMKMLLEQRRQAMLQLHPSGQQFNYPQRCVLY